MPLACLLAKMALTGRWALNIADVAPEAEHRWVWVYGIILIRVWVALVYIYIYACFVRLHALRAGTGAHFCSLSRWLSTSWPCL